MSISELCLYCASAHLLLSISAHCNNTWIIQHYHCYVYHKCYTQDSKMYNTRARSVSVSHQIEYNRWAGYCTTSACISYTRTVCAAPAKQHRHIDLYIRMNHTPTVVDEDRSDTDEGPSSLYTAFCQSEHMVISFASEVTIIN